MGQPRRVLDFNQYARQDEPVQSRPASISTSIEAFRDALDAAGLGRPEIEPDGRLHRFDLPDEARGKRTGWAVFYPDGIPSGAFGSWKHDQSETWCSKANYEMSREEIAAVHDFWRRAKEAAATLRAEEANTAASRAKQIFEAASEATEHPYLARKGVAAFGVRIDQRGELLIPMYNSRGEVRGVQRIMPDGQKRFLSGQANSGLFHVITSSSPDASRTVYVCEGYATGASLHMATGETVVVAFNCGGLEPAALAAKEVFPAAKIIIAADNDRWTQVNGVPKNVGVEAAQKAAQTIGASVVWPEFRDLSSRPKDFNDLYALEGPDAVRAHARGYSVNLREWSLGRLKGKAVPVREWLVDQVIPMDSAMLLAAPGGTGKGIALLDLAIKVAVGPCPGIDLNASAGFFGHQVCAHGPVVCVAAEDDQDEVHRRACALYGDYPENLYVLSLPDMDADKPKAMAIDSREGVKLTTWWEEIVAQLHIISPRLFIVDPLASLVWADLNDRQIGAFVMGSLAGLAKKLHASIVVAHHMNKLKNGIRDLDHAKSEISGSAGFVDHGRGAIALWPEEEAKAKRMCKELGVDYERGKIIRGGLAKNNFPGDTEEKTFVRNEVGLLVPLDHGARVLAAQRQKELLTLLEKAIAHAANQGHPFQHTGKQGLFEKRERLPSPLRELGKNDLNRLGRILLDAKRIDKYRPAKGGSVEQWLDIPGGPFAIGVGELEIGEFENGPES